MISYETDGRILTLRATGTTTLAQRIPVFAAIRDDPRVPDAALLLIDARTTDAAANEHVVVEHVRVLFEVLGNKLGTLCAMIVAPQIDPSARLFQNRALDLALEVSIFDDEVSARRWLVQRSACAA
jgi:hypothetical protein